MSDLAHAGTDHLVDAADTVSKLAVDAVKATADVAGATAELPLKVGEKAVADALAEVEEYRQKFLDALRKLSGSVADAIPTP